MSGESPDVILYDVTGNPLAVLNGAAIPANTSAIMIAGSDGVNSRYLAVNSSGQTVIVGAGSAGSPSGGVLSIQGITNGTAVPISGSVSGTGTFTVNGTVSANQGLASPLSGAWPVQITDGTNTMPTMDNALRPGYVKITDGADIAQIDPTGAIQVLLKTVDWQGNLKTPSVDQINTNQTALLTQDDRSRRMLEDILIELIGIKKSLEMLQERFVA